VAWCAAGGGGGGAAGWAWGCGCGGGWAGAGELRRRWAAMAWRRWSDAAELGGAGTGAG